MSSKGDKLVLALHGAGPGAGREVVYPQENNHVFAQLDEVGAMYVSQVIIDAAVNTAAPNPRVWYLKFNINSSGQNYVQWRTPDSRTVNTAGGITLPPTKYEEFHEGIPFYLGDSSGNQTFQSSYPEQWEIFRAGDGITRVSIKSIGVSIVSRDFATNTETPVDFTGTTLIVLGIV